MSKSIWQLLGVPVTALAVLVRIDPKDARVHVVGKIDPVGRPTFVGSGVCFSGPEQLRRIRNIVPAR